jgi:hypothetical protein
MGRGLTTPQSRARGAFLVLALVALAMRVLAPPGFMVAAQPRGGLPAIVVCTGHGSLTLNGPSPAKTPHDASKGDSACAFAGHAAPVVPHLVASIAAPMANPVSAVVKTATDSAPGRGLAAPPPPSQAPPTVSV